jgi:choline-sulfatase
MLTAILLAALCAAAAPAGPPTVLFILSDDHHHQALGAAGNPHVRTPRLDALAASGARFAQAIAVSPQCGPSRASLLTGHFPGRHGVLSNDHERSRAGGRLPRKWHLSSPPGECGFAEVRLWLPRGQERYRDPRLVHGEEGTPARRFGHITDLLTDDALDFLRESRERRFFLWLAYTAPHHPIAEPREYEDLYRGRPAAELVPPAHAPLAEGARFDWGRYYAAISHLDEAVGRLVAALEELGLRERTLVAFLGDNGYVGGAEVEGGTGAAAAPHVGKVLPVEDSIRVPLVLSLPGRIPRGAVPQVPVSTLDLTATWLDLAGIERPEGLPGESLMGLLDFQGDRAVISEFFGERAMFGEVDPYRLVRTREWKYVLHRSGRERLYHLARDPHERRDLSADPSARPHKEALREKLEN